MTKQLTSSTAYLITLPVTPDNLRTYIVTMTRIHNDINGNPRYQADIASLESLESPSLSSNVARYKFTGHYFSERDDAIEILNRHIRKQ